MGRIVQAERTKGSLKWIQQVVNECPELINSYIQSCLDHKYGRVVEWLSLLDSDDYAEYRDQAFLDLLGIRIGKKKLKHFWPNRGPRWDGRSELKGLPSVHLMFLELSLIFPYNFFIYIPTPWFFKILIQEMIWN